MLTISTVMESSPLPDVTVSRHTAQAFHKDTLVGRPSCFTSTLEARSLCDTHLQPSDFRLWVPRPKPSLAFPSTKVLQILSQWNTCRTWARASPGKRILPVFALSHVSCPIRSITERPLLLPTSHCRPSMGLVVRKNRSRFFERTLAAVNTQPLPSRHRPRRTCFSRDLGTQE